MLRLPIDAYVDSCQASPSDAMTPYGLIFSPENEDPREERSVGLDRDLVRVVS